MYLSVNGGGYVLVLGRLDVLLGHCGVDILINCSFMLSVLRKETGGCLLSLLHFETGAGEVVWVW